MSTPLPSVDAVLRQAGSNGPLQHYGREQFTGAVRAALARYRADLRHGSAPVAAAAIIAAASSELAASSVSPMRPVFNLTGTVIHTNLGRSLLAESAIAAASSAMRSPVALEMDLDSGSRGERDDIVRAIICRLTGAEDVCLVNNNAAAIVLVLSALAKDRDCIVSRGELIEIGGSFRLPDIMACAGTRLIEVGTTNRTHTKDYLTAIGPATALLMKVHTSNYLVQGFTAEVSTRELVELAKSHNLPVVDDLGSGTLVDLDEFGMRRERTVCDALGDGANLVTFSGDKLLGGPQAGFIAGDKDLVRRCAKHPMKRALRLDKVRLAALEATLKLYLNLETLARELPTLRLLSRPLSDIQAAADRLKPRLASAVGDVFDVSVTSCSSQIGSGALPLELLPSAGLSITPRDRAASGALVEQLAQRLRTLRVPVVGRIHAGSVILDLRCLEDETGFIRTIAALQANAPA